MKIIISGYYGFDNIGDEAVLKCIVDEIKNRGINDITVLSNSPNYTSQTYGVKAVNRNSFKDIYKGIKRSDILLSGGGSLLQDVTSSKSLWYYLIIIFLGKLLRKKVYIIGQGIGPINSRFNRWLTKKILNRLSGITVRDQYSKRYLEELGVTKNIIVSADPVVNLTVYKDDGIKAAKEKDGIELDSPYAIICVREWDNSELSRVELARAADSINEEYGYKIVFLPFYYKKDYEESDRVATYMKMPYEILSEKYDIDEMISIIKHSKLLVGIRLHSLIFSFIALTPFIGISYDPKVEGFLKAIGETDIIYIENFTSEQILKKVKNIFNNEEKYIQNLEDNLKKLRELSKENFDMIIKTNNFEV
ncbi:MAG: polysaccharide pyruvyl transferase CsaB [Thermoanaerobacteraceae bacterium]